MNGPSHNGPPPRGNDETANAAAGSNAVLAAALNALRQQTGGADGSAFNPAQLSLFLEQLVSDGDGPEGPLLGRAQRRTLISSAVERVGPEGFARAFVDALNNLRINKTLPAFLADVGPYAVPNADVMHAVFARFGVTDSSPPDERSIVHLFAGLLAIPHQDVNGEPVTNWSALVRCLCALRPATVWPRVVRGLDDLDGFKLPHDARLEGFGAALAITPYDNASNSHAVSGLWGTWNNKPVQLGLLAALLSANPDTFNFALLPGRRIITSVDVGSASATVRQLAAVSERSTWNSLDLVETLVLEAADESPETRQAVNVLLERYSKEAPDLLAMGLLQLPEQWNAYHLELAQRLLSTFFNNTAAGHQLVFYVGYQTNRNFVMQILVRAYLSDPLKVTRIVDVAQDLKALPNLLEFRADPAKPFHFALDVAALASRREVLNADLYFDRMIRDFGAPFMRAALDFLGERLRDELQQQEQDPGQPGSQQQQPQTSTFVAPSVGTVATFLRRLRAHGESMSAEDIEAFKMVRNLALQLHPRLLPIRDSESQEPGMEVATFAQEVHDECDETFGRMYKQQLSVEDVVGILQRNKTSSRPEENELFACMVHTLFDEQKWIRSYPPTELRLTAHLFGDLIQHSLIDYVPLGIAIRGCLDALRTDPGSPTFEFGLEALKRFQGRLRDWPQLAQALQALPPHPDITAIVTRAAQGGDGRDGSSSLTSLDEPDVPVRLPFSSINPGPEVGDADQHEPNDEVSDKVLFAINNLSPSNLDAKLADIRGVLTPQIYRWFAEYLTLERCQLEPNFHGLYLRFLEAVADNKLDAHVLRETLAVAKRLINSDTTVSTLQSRKALQNVGSWLGLITLARDKPIRFKNVDFKTLLIEGYDSGRLIVAVPFVAKVLEQCSKSRVFKLPNPWLNAVLRVLAELYQLPELKLNLRFEIEVLCKSLGVDLKDIQPSAIIRSRELLPPQTQQSLPGMQQQQQAIAGVPTAEMERLGLGGVAARSVQDQQRRAGAPTTAAQQPLVNQAAAAASAAAATAYNESVTQMLQGLPHYVQISPQLSMFQQAPLKRLIYIAIDRAIREIINPVVERSVTIASISTRELVSKDFAMEGDEHKMRDAAHQMAANLAGSLALVTCKEPLRISMVSHARTLFLQSGFTEQTLPEQALMGVMQDNLELACSVIEKAAMDKAMPEVDDGLAASYTARRDHRRRSRGLYWDSNALAASQYAATLPDGLRLKPEGLQPQQYRVYQEFGNLTRSLSGSGVEDERGQAAAAAAAAAAVGAGTAGPSPIPGPGPNLGPAGGVDQFGYGGPDGVANVLTAQQSLEKFSACIAEVERLLAEAGADESITSLPQGHELRDVVRQVPIIASQSQNRDEAALVFSQKVVQLMFKSETALARDIFVILLERLCEVSLKVAKEVTAWLVYAEDERKFNVPVTVSLIRAGLMNIAETDVQVTKLLVREFKPSLVDYAANLALECLREPACATRGQLANITEALNRAAQQGKATPAAKEFLEELKAGTLNTKTDITNGPLREQLGFCFSEWVRNSQLSPNSEKLFVDFVTSLQSQGILKGEEISSMFFRVCTEVAVDGYIKAKAAGGSMVTGIFCPVDSFAKMVVLMIKYHADASGANNEQAKVHYLTKILSIIVLVLAQSHEELGRHFQQKPFYRLLSSLLHELRMAETGLQGVYMQSLLAMSNTLNTLQPSFFPSFTFSWMSLVSHRLFMPKLLSDRQHGWPAFHRLLCSMLRFLGPILRTAELQETSRSLYKGTLRILLVLLHDFPEFLAAYHFSLMDLIPDNCIQMRNLVLSAFPRDRRLPDPFSVGLKMDQMADSAQAPVVLSDYQAALSTQASVEFKRGFLHYIQQRGPASFLSSLKDAVTLRDGRASAAAESEDGQADGTLELHHNVQLINSLVMSAAVSALERPTNVLASSGASADVGVDVVSALVKSLDAEGRYYVLSACVNQLRFPCSHTAYFNQLLLYLYRQNASDEEIKAQILRVLLERIIVNRPHPWGTLCTTFELLRNASGQYALPKGMPLEIERLVEHVKAGLDSGNGSGSMGPVGIGSGRQNGSVGEFGSSINSNNNSNNGVGAVGSGSSAFAGSSDSVVGSRSGGSNLGAVGQ